MARDDEPLPLARTNRLLIEELPDEVLVYDLETHRAYCLNLSASALWSLCDGNTSVTEMATRLQGEAMGPIDEEVIRYGLELLGKHRLLDEPVARPSNPAALSRRDLARKIGLSISVPIVTSLLAPEASASASCVGTPCSNDVECQARGCTSCSSSFPHVCH